MHDTRRGYGRARAGARNGSMRMGSGEGRGGEGRGGGEMRYVGTHGRGRFR